MTQHLLVVGAQRCGTTYLHSLLEAHPDIAMARPARPEPKVFLGEEVLERGAEWYRTSYFAHARGERVLGEKSTSYIEHPEAARRAERVLGEVHVVAVLRDPVARAVSNWRFSSDHGFETRPLEQALEENLAGSHDWDPSATSVSPFAYLERGRYADFLGPWRQVFPGTTRVLFFDELTSDPTVLRDLYAALGVDPGFRPAGLETPVNQSSRPAPDLPPGLVADLRDYFTTADAALADLLGRELPW